MKTFICTLLLMLATLAGCTRPPAVNDANTLKTKSFIAASEGKTQIVNACLAGLKKAEYEIIDLKVEAEVQRQLAEVKKNTPADGKVNVDQAIAGMQRITDFRDHEREKNRAIVDGMIERIRTIATQTDDQLAIGLKLEDLISQYDNTGLDLSNVRTAVTQIMDAWKKKSSGSQAAAADFVPLK
jgi:hypothetical protein